jgi:hypothetical protein
MQMSAVEKEGSYQAFLKALDRQEVFEPFSRLWFAMNGMSVQEQVGMLEAIEIKVSNEYRNQVKDTCCQGSCGVRASTESQGSADSCVDGCASIEAGDRDAS